jgi:hypothetical protein
MENKDAIGRRMSELVRPLDEAILMCDNREDILMLASILLIRLSSLYDAHIGVEGRKEIFRSLK